jgi:spore germination cell wall hydrolase CwlJ-like protein
MLSMPTIAGLREAAGRVQAALARRPGLSAVCAGYGLFALTAGLHLTGALGPRDKAEIFPPLLAGADQVECLALNIYHEARGEPADGQVAVAQVVLNRVADRRFPSDICGVVKQGFQPRRRDCQFSWWCDGRSDRPLEPLAWDESKRLAEAVLAGQHKDPTGGALWYHADSVTPKWRMAIIPARKIGRHQFYLPAAENR